MVPVYALEQRPQLSFSLVDKLAELFGVVSWVVSRGPSLVKLSC